MNEIHNRNAHHIEKSIPGCLGRMVNLFDLGTFAAGNRLLTEKPHYDGSTLLRSLSDVATLSSPSFADQIEDKMILPDLRGNFSNKKANGTPMKMLLAQEMSKDVEANFSTPNVVAKLMGLDALPRQEPHSAAVRGKSKGHKRRSLSHSGIPSECWQQDGFSDKGMQHEIDNHAQTGEYKDVHEIWKQSQQTKNLRENSPQKQKQHTQNANDKMALVCQKFSEEKHLPADEKLCHPKEFQNAFEFLKFMQEPNPLFSQQRCEVQPIPPPPGTKRITILRPTKLIESENCAGLVNKTDKQTKNLSQVVKATAWDKNIHRYSPTFTSQKGDEYPPQATRIVVLKPSPGRTYDVKAVVSPPTPPRMLHDNNFYEEHEDDEAYESREVAKKITQHMRENLMGHRRDETLLSSVFSNGYIGDESSFDKSENEYAVGTDAEVVSPTSRHSWEYINRFGSPYSSSSFGRVSCSPESSVCREAKKRLSERWAMMASNGCSQEQRHVQRSSSTLGEMLALSDTRKSLRSEDECSITEQESRVSTSCLRSNVNDEGADPSKDLLRSKSVPVSLSVYEINNTVEVSDPANTPVSKAKSVKSSFKGKVSSLFFSKNKKSNKGKSSHSHSKDESETMTAAISGSSEYLTRKNGSAPKCIDDRGHECLSYEEESLSVAKHAVPGHVSGNQDQPSPISVLEPPFEEDYSSIMASSSNIKMNNQGIEAPVHPIKSNLIDKSPSIGSIARTLSWDDSCTGTATSYPFKPSMVSPVENKHDWLTLAQTLVSMSGLDGKLKSDSLLDRWHSPDSPLDLTLREKYVNMHVEPRQEAHQRQLISLWKLIFDIINATLVEITGYGSERSLVASPCRGAHRRLLDDSSPVLVDLVWGRMDEWFSNDVRCIVDDRGDRDSLVVEGLMREELEGKGWVDHMRMEVDNFGKEIEEELLDELVDEAVADSTDMA